MLGIVTIVSGAIGWLLIVDFPDNARFLTEEERRHGTLQFQPLITFELKRPVASHSSFGPRPR